MILVFSTSSDYTTKEILEWLDLYNKKYLLLINSNHSIKIDKLSISNYNEVSLTIQKNAHDFSINTKDISAIFYRGGRIEPVDYFQIPLRKESIETPNLATAYYLNAYNISRKEVLRDILDKKYKIGNEDQGRINKLITLQKASELGIRIPESLTTTSRQEVKKFASLHKKIILKSLDLNFSFSDNQNFFINSYTSSITTSDIATFPKHFPISLFQKEIAKEYEIRSFYLNVQFYSMAIFSQQNPDTMTDWRKYGSAKTNRVLPYKLPAKLESQLVQLMENLNLKTGSIDLIRSKDGEYYFLEVNPIGQFAYTSGMCNYYLEKKISQLLAASN